MRSSPGNPLKIPLMAGFTLIELSIVLVVIGLIVGGVLVGQDLIRASQVRATISQVEKFNSATNTFYGKYQALPGDMNAQVATAFGFTPRGAYAGQGDGNGVIEGANRNLAGRNYGWVQGAGETLMFWVDLTTANGLNVNLIDGSFSAGSPTATPASTVSGTAIANYYPAAKLGGGNYFYVYNLHNGGSGGGNPVNYFGLSAVTSIAAGLGSCEWCLGSNPGLTVQQAYAIDAKIDDGKPASGNVIAQYEDGVAFSGIGVAPNAVSASSSTCYDTTSKSYSVTVSNGSNVNCALSFKMQAGDQ